MSLLLVLVPVIDRMTDWCKSSNCSSNTKSSRNLWRGGKSGKPSTNTKCGTACGSNT